MAVVYRSITEPCTWHQGLFKTLIKKVMKSLFSLRAIIALAAIATTLISCEKETEPAITRVLYRIHAADGAHVTLRQNYTGETISEQIQGFSQYHDNVKPGDSLQLHVTSPGEIKVEIIRSRQMIYQLEDHLIVSLDSKF